MDYELSPRTRIGHVHLTVANLDRALSFYRDLMGFQVTARFGKNAVFFPYMSIVPFTFSCDTNSQSQL